ncbi:hypothetical protein J1605_015828 [Eschrichtius robustus]|uniref:Uncharacterized protein n=1 Tax=Eschrichtius robustus TaxID=9764 RepID=A0AB34G8C5_ESCRO|nr:hypothetical protein J1605_015828 [Eschrichtius robustus]
MAKLKPKPLFQSLALSRCPQVVQHDVLGKVGSTRDHRGGPPKLPRGREKQLAEGAAEVVRMREQYQDLPWTVAFLGGPGVKTERQHSPVPPALR